MAYDDPDLRDLIRSVADRFDLLMEEIRKRDLLPPTPQDAHAMRRQADEAREHFAWLHHCGTLNHGYWEPGAMCSGCRFSVDKAGHVDEHYRLVPVEGLGDDEGRG
ncbi:hypothetical protein [Nonomuraea sp. NPDC050643]|uniref:hypothetical protein n=1 Tax=Nonomuraea sp. NPDC050643 TaxID=3155660 RepID=UPI0033FD94C5